MYALKYTHTENVVSAMLYTAADILSIYWVFSITGHEKATIWNRVIIGVVESGSVFKSP